MLDPNDFTLQAVDGGYIRDLPARWCFGDRAFGGYTAALALGALLESGSHAVAASLSVTFLEAGVAGPVEIEVETLRAGRSAAVARATVHQAGRPILTATGWLVDGWDDDVQVPAPTPALAPSGQTDRRTADAVVGGPEAGASLAWLVEHWPVLGYAERTGVDYPVSWAGFARGRPEVALWARMIPPPGATDDPLVPGQVGDVLHLDGHLFDAPGQVTGYDEADLLSLDLTIAWQPGSHRVPSTAWRLIECRGSVAARVATSYASVRDNSGALLAVATSQGLVRR